VPESEVKALLRMFLIPNGALGIDSTTRKFLISQRKDDLPHLMQTNEFIRRLFSTLGAWQGISWVLDLVPDYPRKALDVLDAYAWAHAGFLPDGRMNGLADAEAIIRHRYFHQNNPRDVLLNLTPSEFEFLIAAFFDEMGYDVEVTQATVDGGIDVIAKSTKRGKAEFVLIQCKRYVPNVTVSAVRELMGVVSRMQANKGMLISTSEFTRPARKEALSTPMIEVLGFRELNLLMNEYFGPRWPSAVTHRLRDMQRRLSAKFHPGPSSEDAGLAMNLSARASE
jgi:restriction system protein